MRRVFAYGSNLWSVQMRERCPSARLVGPARLWDHRLVFGGHSRRWGGAVATIERSIGAEVIGCVYELSRADLARLDGFEGSYARRARFVEIGQEPRLAQLYVLRVDPSSRRPPPDRYRATMARGYAELGLPLDHLEQALARVRG